jgi:DNA-binding transcriptional LysR family regulator
LGHQRRLARSGAMSALLPISAVAADIEIGRKVPLATNSAPEKIRAVLT